MTAQIGVIGAGAWGTALAQSLAADGTEVLLWARDGAACAEMQASRRNARYLPEAELPLPLSVNPGTPSRLADPAPPPPKAAPPDRLADPTAAPRPG